MPSGATRALVETLQDAGRHSAAAAFLAEGGGAAEADGSNSFAFGTLHRRQAQRCNLGRCLRRSPWADPSPAAQTAFYEVQCAQGFKCVSKLDVFGVGHDGNFKKADTADLPARLLNAYEWGCPAAGEVNESSGLCEGPGTDGGYCYSSKRYEAGPGTPCDSDDKCFCIKPTTATGNPADDKSRDVIKGEELQYGTFNVQPVAKCDSCDTYNCDRDSCNACPGCEYTTKTVELPDPTDPDGTTTYVRKQLGCFDSASSKGPGSAKSGQKALLYLGGQKAVQRDLQIVPHYSLWDPGDPAEDGLPDKNLRLPYQSHREPLSREAWLAKYKEAAPNMQKLMDLLAMRLLDGTSEVDAWSPKDATGPPEADRLVSLDNCWTQGNAGDDIAGKLDKFLSVQRVCKRMQETERLLAGGSTFSADKAECGAFAWDDEKEARRCGCHHGFGKEAGQCKALSCYGDREDVAAAVSALKAKLKSCSKEHREAQPVVEIAGEGAREGKKKAASTADSNGHAKKALATSKKGSIDKQGSPFSNSSKEGDSASSTAMPKDKDLETSATAGGGMEEQGAGSKGEKDELETELEREAATLPPSAEDDDGEEPAQGVGNAAEIPAAAEAAEGVVSVAPQEKPETPIETSGLLTGFPPQSMLLPAAAGMAVSTAAFRPFHCCPGFCGLDSHKRWRRSDLLGFLRVCPQPDKELSAHCR
eukprot:TRINITY_DN102571_c0_g1_i1.p1 TRINITY_DN102571_c0_g1~~TRINITY_DN102571_c0_g1_i1.p1  ORF type:complete len:702 (+),score=199.40 TRINITY_DN102571_c0_g1_i1:64-2169(+)